MTRKVSKVFDRKLLTEKQRKAALAERKRRNSIAGIISNVSKNLGFNTDKDKKKK